ncbi:MAG: hypothetical protein GX285_07020 [Clostridiales bacterium]|nr:hypothetical protein [Clostridiales bacterium]
MTGFYLKIIAITTMLIDHIGAVFLDFGSLEYLVFRSIGRLAFPIFAFLIAEGCEKTSDIKRYMLRLFIFAWISEVPFDLAFYNSFFDFSHQNIFFTLFLGAAAIYIYNLAYNKDGLIRYGAYIIPFALMIVAEALRTDYGAIGVFLIFFIYLNRERRLNKFIIIALGNAMLTSPKYPVQLFGIVSLIPLYFYNGERGRNIKYIFYIFYPLHLLVLGIINRV